jgi:hypothetical protein
MKHNLALNLIYHPVVINLGESAQPGNYYKVLYFFSEAHFIPERTLEEAAKKHFMGEMEHKLMFSNLDDLSRYALAICEELSAPEVFVLSSEDYNSGVEGTRDIRNFREIYRRFGHSLLNPAFKKEKSSTLFGKFFKT